MCNALELRKDYKTAHLKDGVKMIVETHMSMMLECSVKVYSSLYSFSNKIAFFSTITEFSDLLVPRTLIVLTGGARVCSWKNGGQKCDSDLWDILG